ncbi:MAG TPA: GNAT family N-acetyltransferase [Polyangia bacterium]|nr:GNAT family N-acetyltransferase [Polyangia bacterium]
MDALTLDELDRESDAFDRCVAESGDLDRFCSSSDWALPAARALMPRREPWVRRGRAGYAAFMRAEHPGAIALEPLEAMWALGCPLVGADARAIAGEFVEAASRERAVVLVSGLERTSARFDAIARAMQPRYALRLGPPARRYVASLDGGLDGFLARRSANVRRGLKRALHRAAERSLAFERADVRDPEAAFERLLAVERASWKGASGVGIEGSDMAGFYRAMVPRLHRRGALELMFARDGGRDVAYILGGIFGDTYRGLQFSYAEGYEDCALGNLCQYHQVALLCERGLARYDLGAEVEYKRRWGEIVHETVTLLGFPR